MALLSSEEIEALIHRSAFNHFLGIKVESLDAEHLTLKLPFKEEFLRGNEKIGFSIHGGILASLIDITGDFVFATVDGRPLPTINLRVDYLRPAPAADVYAEAVVVKRGKTISVSDITVYRPDHKKVAIGRGLYHGLR
ncbi:MAG: PaaI family thioesterase [Sporolactobacillus sp.]|jgi:uncharacterized protein (TIGR00369 family)|nr:PaaI family thioesterase [Sporolactobacillus sp.]MCI1881121.1 PaaI family thioesterase [Sporolactobacillus sp.]